MSDKAKEWSVLVDACIEGKRSAQHQLFKIFYSKMYLVCSRYARTNDEAQDMVNEGFIKVFAHLSQLRDVMTLESWVKRIMIHSALDYQRKYRTQSVSTVEYEEVSDAQFNHYEVNSAVSNLSSDELLALIQRLPATSKAVFNLYVFEDYAHAEIAEMLQMKEGTSHWHLNFARKKLKEWITENER